MAEPARTFAATHERTSRLYQLGIKEETLREAIERGLDARKRCTDFHPPSAPGFYQWAETHVALRELLIPEGWKDDDAGGFSTVISPDGQLAITVATGDDRTGKEGLPAPETKYPRGPMTHSAIESNQQLAMDLMGGIIFPEEEPHPKHQTWILLLSTRHNEVRMELSCPKAIGEDGRVDSWSERIILRPLDIEPTIPIPEDEADLPDIDVPVERR